MSGNLGTDEREIDHFIRLNQSELEKIDVRGAVMSKIKKESANRIFGNSKSFKRIVSASVLALVLVSGAAVFAATNKVELIDKEGNVERTVEESSMFFSKDTEVEQEMQRIKSLLSNGEGVKIYYGSKEKLKEKGRHDFASAIPGFYSYDTLEQFNTALKSFSGVVLQAPAPLSPVDGFSFDKATVYTNNRDNGELYVKEQLDYDALTYVKTASGQEFGYEIIPANKKAYQIELNFVNEEQHHFKYFVSASEGVVTSHTYVKNISDGSKKTILGKEVYFSHDKETGNIFATWTNGTFTKDGLDYLWNSQVSSEDATEAEMVQWIEEVMKQSPIS